MKVEVLQCDYCHTLLVTPQLIPRPDVSRITQICSGEKPEDWGNVDAHDFCNKYCYEKYFDFLAVSKTCNCERRPSK